MFVLNIMTMFIRMVITLTRCVLTLKGLAAYYQSYSWYNSVTILPNTILHNTKLNTKYSNTKSKVKLTTQ